MRRLALSILSSSLFLLPVVITVAVYAGVESQKVIDVLHGKIPVQPAAGGGIPRPTGPRVIATQTYCNKTYAVDPYPGRYIYNPNQWGDPQDTGGLCLSVTTDTGASPDMLNAFNFSATWHYPARSGEPVHAFPNAQFSSAQMPMLVSQLQNLKLDVEWSYSVGDSASTSTDPAALVAANLNANVAVDMFLDNDKTKSGNSTSAAHEVMIWLGQFGLATQPLGMSPTPVDTTTVGSTTFNLYYGTNEQGQNVFTWMSVGNMTTFSGNVAPLITLLANNNAGPQSNAYLGYMAFGSETFDSDNANMTFAVPQLTMQINNQ